MRTSRIFFITIIFLWVIFCTSSLAETNRKEKIINLLLERGLENIAVEEQVSNCETIVISYENRTFLHDMRLLGNILLHLNNIIQAETNLIFLPQGNGIVISQIELNYQDYLNFRSKKINEQEFAQNIRILTDPTYSNKEKINPLIFHTDLTLAPAYAIGEKTGPVIYFSPYLNTYLDYGISFSNRIRLPLYSIINNFDFTKNQQQFPAGFSYSYLEYTNRILNLPFYTSFRLGYWDNGFPNLMASNYSRYMFGGGLVNLNLKTGIAYNLEYPYWDYSILPSVDYYIGAWDMYLESGLGKFLNNNYMVWGKLTRQFKNTDLSFALYRKLGEQGGWSLNFEYTIALGTEHGINASSFRLTYPRFFSGLLYAGLRNPGSVPTYLFLPDFFLRRMYPEYIKHHLYYWLED